MLLTVCSYKYHRKRGQKGSKNQVACGTMDYRKSFLLLLSLRFFLFLFPIVFLSLCLPAFPVPVAAGRPSLIRFCFGPFPSFFSFFPLLSSHYCNLPCTRSIAFPCNLSSLEMEMAGLACTTRHENFNALNTDKRTAKQTKTATTPEAALHAYAAGPLTPAGLEDVKGLHSATVDLSC